MDAFGPLRQDHERVRGLFSNILSGAGEREASLFNELRAELENYSRVEEDVLYPSLQHTSALRDMIGDARAEHSKLRGLLLRIDNLELGSAEWRSAMEELSDVVEHHVQDEENQLFPQADQALSENEKGDLEARLLSELETLEVLSHPGKPGPHHRY